MATIDAKKLLPPSKKSGAIEKQKFLVPLRNISTNRISTRDLRPVDRETSADESLSIIKKKISRLSLLLEESYLIEKKEREARRKAEERRRSEQRERNLERKVKKNKVSPNLISSIPGQSIFDKINRFIGFTLLGYLFNKYGELLPKLLEFGRVLKPVGEFVESFAKNLLKGAIDFVEFGYKAYDQTRDFVKQIGGEGAQKTFDEFSKNLNILLNGAIASAMLIASTSPGKPGRPGRMPGGKPSTLPKNAKLSSYLGRDAQTKLIERRYGNDAARMYEARKSQGASASRARADVLKRFDKIEGPQRGLAGGTGKGSVLSRGFGKSANRASLKVLGKTGTRIAKGVFGRVPIIGGLLDFAFSLAMGEDPGRAAAKAVGATVGSALGTFIPVPFAGTILGGILGDVVGGALYDSLVGSKKPEGRAEGGQVTRGGQSSVTPSRRLKTRPRKAPPRIQPQKTQPGKDIGGKLKIEELYGKDEPGKRSALRALRKSSDDVKKMRTINGLAGSMFGAGIDMALGQKPDKNLSRNLGNIFGSVIASAVDMELNNSFGDISKTIAMAGGGVVPSREIGRQLSIGERIGNFISRAFAVSIESSAARILQNLRNEMNLEGGAPGETPYDQPPPSGEPLEYEVKGGELPSSYPGRGTEGHGYPGRDYQIVVGKAITVFKPGTVTYARLNPSGYGNLVIIKHKDGTQTVYAHLSKINTKEGDEIKEGEKKVIGLTGGAAGAPGAGNSTGPHLHFEVRNSAGKQVTKYNDGDAYFRFGTVTGVRKRTPKELDKLRLPPNLQGTGKTISGKASFYGGPTDRYWEGRQTASGEVFDSKKMTAAMMSPGFDGRSPFYAKVTNTANNKSVVVRVNDTGGFGALGRVIDLSHGAFSKIANPSTGVVDVVVEKLRSAPPQPGQLGRVLSSTKGSDGATYTVREGGKYFKNGKPITQDEYDKAFGLQLSMAPSQPQSPSVAFAGNEIRKTDTRNIYGIIQTDVVFQEIITSNPMQVA